MKKRIISILLIICTLSTLFPTAALAVQSEKVAEVQQKTMYSNPYQDVNCDDWYYDAVQYVNCNGFFKGTSSTTFSPNGTMTRGMFVTVLARMAGVDTAVYSGETPFSDVEEGAWYAPAVLWAAKYGITGGTGNGTFSPNATINREQMAAFFVRYFEAFDVNYDTGANIQSVPKDLNAVAPWAQDAVLKLWKQGLLNGDGTNFAPSAKATRAQAATLCTRVDKAVETWYSEPGVESTRVSIDPATGEAVSNGEETETPEVSHGGNHGYSSTTYYKVEFDVVSGQSKDGLTFSDTDIYAAGTKISSIPTPFAQGMVFLGWYYDAAMENAVASDDVVDKNMTLYAKMGELTDLETETPNYITVSVPAGSVNSYSVTINGYEDGAVVALKNITDSTQVITPAATISGFAAGQTYRIELSGDSAATFEVVKFNDAGIEQTAELQPASVRILNIVTEKTEVDNLSLNSGVKCIASTSVSNMTGTALDGLFSASVNPADKNEGVKQNKNVGTFTYTGSGIAVGDTVAIYSGTRPDQRNLTSANDGAVAYVEITAKSGTSYTYKTADAEDVLFTPDILPLSTAADTDGSTTNHSVTVPMSAMDYSDAMYAEMGLDALTTVDKGDIIAFYTGTLGGTQAKAGYAKIKTVTESGNNYIITYSDATEADVMAVMDLYSTRNDKIELTSEQQTQIESEMENQALESGFVEEAAAYLTALALETDGFHELSEDMDWDLKSYNISFADGAALSSSDMQLMGTSAIVTDRKITAKVSAGSLEHFEGSYGIRAELVMTFKVEIGEKIEINLQAIFEQEVMISVNANGGAIWKWKWIIPYIYDYQLNANIDLGTYTGIGITATASTVGEEDDKFGWKPVTTNKGEAKLIDIGKQITELMEMKESFMNQDVSWGDDDNDIGGIVEGGLLDKYASMMENAEETWIDIVRVNIFKFENSVDPLHILCYGVSADFVVKANLYVTMGMTFEYGVAKRYNFNIHLFHKQSSSETIDLEEAHYNFDFYVMGTAGVRAGIELEVAVGLFSLDLDSIGICAEVGAYAQLWGYFYYHCGWTQSGGRESSSSGAMAIEIGIYLTISFKAQLFSSDKLTYQPTLYDNQWPLLTIGSTENVYDFSYDDDDEMLNIELQNVTQTYLPTALFNMDYMDLKSGDLYGRDADDSDENPALNCDDETESRYTIELSNPKFKYHPNGNKLTLDPGTSVSEECEITIVWKNGTLAFTSEPISRTVTVTWRDDANAHYINFDADGGSGGTTMIVGPNDEVNAPTAPTKQGYTFGGWYSDISCTKEVKFPITVGEAKGLNLYAKWNPADNTPYTVEYYLQELNGTYTKAETTTKATGKTDSMTSVYNPPLKLTVNKETVDIQGKYYMRPVVQQTIAANGSTVVKVYLNRNTFTVEFAYGAVSTEKMTYTAKYGATIYPPTLTMGGYDFTGFGGITDEEMKNGLTVTEDKTYTASWTARSDTPYKVEYYVQRINGRYEPWVNDGEQVVVYGEGTTGGRITLSEDLQRTIPGMAYQSTLTTADGKALSEASIKGDGTTVVKLFYTRNSYPLTIIDSLTGSTYKTVNYRYDETIPMPAASTFTKPNYAYGGLYNDQDCSENMKVDFAANPEKMTAEGRTVYIKWIPNTYHVTLNRNGGTLTDTLTGYTFGVGADLPTPTRANYTFDGWYTDSNFTGSKVTEISTTDSGDKTYTAKWTSVSYTITQNIGDGASITTATSQTYTVESAAITLAQPTKTGYTFTGWTGSNGDTPQTSVTIAKGSYGDKIYTANWTANTYTLSFNAGYTDAPAIDSQSVTYDAQIGTLPTPAARDGYTFSGWKHGDTAVTAATTWEWTEATPTLTAEWTAISYNLAWDFDGGNTTSTGYTQGNVAYGTTITKPSNPTKTGYTFAGWLVNGSEETVPATMPVGALTIKAKWTVNSYNLTWRYNNGAADKVETVNYGAAVTAPANPGKTGYTFAGWDKSIATMPAANTTVNATWTANTYTLSFDAGYTGAPAINSQSVTYDAQVGTLPTPERDGYALTGWYYTDGQTKVPVNSATAWKVAGDKTLIAEWTEGTSYSITYIEDNNSGNRTQYTQYTAAFTLTNPTKEGYDFLGWTGSNGTTPEKTVTIAKGSTGDKTYTANWQVRTHTLTWNVNGGSALTGDYTSGTVAYGTTITKPADPTRTGYTFTGWDKTGTTMPDEDVTLTAQWTVNTHSITWNFGEGATPSESYTTAGTYDYGTEITAPTLSRTGYSYTWKVNGKDVTTLPTNLPDCDLTITAVWTANKYTLTWSLGGGTATNTYTENGEYDYGTAITAPTFADRSGYNFKGWKIGDSTEVVQANALPTTLTETVTITAVWEAKTLSVTLIYPDGSKVSYGGGTINDTTFSYLDDGNTHNLPTSCTYGSKSFEGWYTDQTFQTKVTTVGADDVNKTFYAKFTFTATLNVTCSGRTIFPAEGQTYLYGSSITSAEGSYSFKVNYIYGQGLNLMQQQFMLQPTGKEIISWSDSLSLIYKTIAATETGDKTYNAVLQDATYTVVLDAGEGATITGISGGNVPNNGKYSANKQTYTFTYQTSTYSSSHYLIADATTVQASKENYTLKGWKDDNETQNINYFEIGKIAHLLYSGNKTVHAVWEPTRYKLQFNLNAPDGTQVTNPNPDYYTYLKVAGKDNNVQDESFTLEDPTCTGYTFLGWYTSADFAATSKLTAIPQGTKADYTLYAKWEKTKYKVTFNYNGSVNANGKESVVLDVEYGTTLSTVVPADTKWSYGNYNYTLQGWYTEQSCNDLYQMNSSIKITGDKTYYAKVTKSEITYTVTYYDKNGDELRNSYYQNSQTVYITNPYINTASLPTKTVNGITAYATGWKIGNTVYTVEALANYQVTGDISIYATGWDKGFAGTWAELKTLLEASNGPKDVYLTSDITYYESEASSNAYISINHDVTIHGNGKTISRNCDKSTASAREYIINVYFKTVTFDNVNFQVWRSNISYPGTNPIVKISGESNVTFNGGTISGLASHYNGIIHVQNYQGNPEVTFNGVTVRDIADIVNDNYGSSIICLDSATYSNNITATFDKCYFVNVSALNANSCVIRKTDSKVTATVKDSCTWNSSLPEANRIK